MRLLVTGGAGFIGSALVRTLLGAGDAADDRGDEVVNIDKLTYAASPEALAVVERSPRYAFERVDVCDRAALRQVFARHRPEAVIHLAAESHVDRSIDAPGEFVRTNVVGTYELLEAARAHFATLEPHARQRFRFLHVSTDEVFGSLGGEGLFTETTPYQPSSPYSATKAASDHLARAWHRTYGLPVVLTNCSNNYGPYQFPEKLIPLMILSALEGRPLPVYGKGENVRDWLYVDDHARGLRLALERGQPGESYNLGGESERTNLEVVEAVAGLLDRLAPGSIHVPHRKLIAFVADRPGHDLRYAMDIARARRELGFAPREDFASGLEKTVRWYLDNRPWWTRIQERYRQERLGLGGRP